MSPEKLDIFKNTQFNKGLAGGYIVVMIDFVLDSTIYRGRYTSSYPFIISCYMAATIFMASYVIWFIKRGPLVRLDNTGIILKPDSRNYIRITWSQIIQISTVQFNDAIEAPEFLNQLCITTQSPIKDINLGNNFKIIENSRILININLPNPGIEDTINLIQGMKTQNSEAAHPAT